MLASEFNPFSGEASDTISMHAECLVHLFPVFLYSITC